MHSNRGLFQPEKKERAFEWSCALAQEGAIGPFFEGDMPLNRILVIAPILGTDFRVLFYGGVSPSEIDPIAPY
jgi:hypothetical protein